MQLNLGVRWTTHYGSVTREKRMRPICEACFYAKGDVQLISFPGGYVCDGCAARGVAEVATGAAVEDWPCVQCCTMGPAVRLGPESGHGLCARCAPTIARLIPQIAALRAAT